MQEIQVSNQFAEFSIILSAEYSMLWFMTPPPVDCTCNEVPKVQLSSIIGLLIA